MGKLLLWIVVVLAVYGLRRLALWAIDHLPEDDED